MEMLSHFKWPAGITVAAVILWGIFGSPQDAVLVAILCVLEISLSFDNAVVNAKYVGMLNDWWQRLFLTLGLLIAVFGMRLIFPIVIVCVTSHLGPVHVLDLAINHPSQYATELDAAHAGIAALGGTFLFMIFLSFLFDADREIHWAPFEHHFQRFAKLIPSAAVTLLMLLLVAQLYVQGQHEKHQVLVFGVAGIFLNIAVSALNDYYEEREEDGSVVKNVVRVGSAALSTFLFLEVLDASFSFDGVTGAFAISQNIFIIATGLGCGALFVRELTVYMVRRGTLDAYRYLEHGAHYAIGALAVILIITIRHDVPEWFTGLIGVAFIGWACWSSVQANKRDEAEEQRRAALATRLNASIPSKENV